MPTKMTRLIFFEEVNWKVKDDLLNWVRRQANRTGFTIVIHRFNLINPMLQSVCERSGDHKLSGKKKLKHEATGLRKCGRMFMVRGYLSRQTNDWRLNILNGVHNHEMEPSLEGHMHAGRLKNDDKKLVRDLTTSLVLPRNILLNLKTKRQDCKTNTKKEYNERQQIWKSNRGDKTVLQYEISKLEEHNYVYFTLNIVKVLLLKTFWAHPTSVKLFNNFPTVLVMDSIYKTNTYRMPMFEIVGVTSTDLTYYVAFGFVTHEKEENFVWVLQMMLKLFKFKD